MTKRALLSISLSALAVAGVVAGQGFAADKHAAKAAASDARRASRALDKHDGAAAIRWAEAAVTLQPRAAGYRMLLGQGYLQAGRFQSAAAAFADVLRLDPDNARAGLNLALAQIACGDWGLARDTLAAHHGRIPAADHGLALALAGDPGAAVAMLMEAARQPGADAKLRQNLALSLALAGQWQAARVTAAADMSPADVDRRLEQWAAFAQPRAASDQVATLLGVEAAADTGQPVALALAAPVPATPAPAAPVRTAAVEAVTAAPAAPAIAPDAVADVASPVPAATTALVFAPRQEVVQPLPVPLIRAPGDPARLAMAKALMTRRVQPVSLIDGEPVRILHPRDPAVASAAGLASGSWHVQLGAFENAAVARDAWARLSRRQGLAGHTPQGASVTMGGTTYYRLSVGGFARADADGFCRRLRASGAACFVRAAAGDRTAAWGRAGPAVAARGGAIRA